MKGTEEITSEFQLFKLLGDIRNIIFIPQVYSTGTIAIRLFQFFFCKYILNGVITITTTSTCTDMSFDRVHVFDSYVHEDERGVHPEVEFIYDLKLPEDFEPINADGEVQEFKLYPVTQVKNETFYTKKIIIIFNLFQNDN